MRTGILPNALCAGLLCASIALAEAPSLVAIRDARIFVGNGTVIEKGTVLIRDGLISEVGTSVNVPASAWVVEGVGLMVYPGLIDGLSSWGIPQTATTTQNAGGRAGGGAPGLQALVQGQTPGQPAAQRSRGPEDRPGTTSWVHAADLVSPTDRRMEQARSAGFTTAVTFPRTGMIAGHGAVVNLGGERPNSMIVHPSAGLYLSMSTQNNGYPNSLLGVIAYIRQVWLDVDHYRMAKDMYAKNPVGMQRPEYDRALEGVMEANRILLPAVSKVQISRMIKFGKELKTPSILYGAHEGYRAADILAAAKLPVLVSLRWPTKARDTDPEDEDDYDTLELRDKAPTTPAVLAKAGVKFAFFTDTVETPREAIRAVKRAIDSGLSREAALRALSLGAAEIYGVADRLGSVEKGKIANIVVTKADIFDDRPQVQMIFVDGVKYDPAPETPTAPGGMGQRPTNAPGEEK